MAITAEDIQLRIGSRLSPSRLGERVAECVDASCNECGDVCPIRARNWRQRNAKSLRSIFSDPDQQVYEVHFSCTTWHQKIGFLADVNVQTVFKAARRALDSLQDPGIVAVGLVDAAWNGNKWKVGITIFVRTPNEGLALHRAFDRKKNVDWPSSVELAHRPYSGLEQLLRAGQHAKTWPDRRILLKPGACREYYRWLASLRPRARLFRYGCDHHFNLLNKPPKPTRWRLPKRRPSPRWLTPYQYGSHPGDCECNICRSRQNR